VKDTLATHLAALQTINKVQPELVNKESRRIRNFVMGELFPLRLPKIAGTSISNECIAIVRYLCALVDCIAISNVIPSSDKRNEAT